MRPTTIGIIESSIHLCGRAVFLRVLPSHLFALCRGMKLFRKRVAFILRAVDSTCVPSAHDKDALTLPWLDLLGNEGSL